MCGFPRGPSTFQPLGFEAPNKVDEKAERCTHEGSGRVTTNGGKGDDKPPMNPRGGPSPMNPKAYKYPCKLNPTSYTITSFPC